MNDYENFQMKSSELIQDIFTRFTNIMKKAHGIEKGAPQGGTDMQCFSPPTFDWDSKVTVIKESRFILNIA